ncbi:MAG: PKD domain-containing protein [Bacteroidota bacterium]
MKKNLLTLTSCLLLSVALVVFYGCEKEDIVQSSTLDNHQSQKGSFPELMKEPLVQDMLNDLKPYGIFVNAEGILEFSSKEDINDVIDILESYNNKFDDDSLMYPTDPMLVAFETAYQFTSLRRKIEYEITLLEDKEQLTVENDPDDHHIVSEYLRTVLTPDNEVEINNLVCVYAEQDIGIGIMDEDYFALDSLQNILRGNTSQLQQTVGQFCLTDENAFLLGDEDYLEIDFTHYVDNNNPLKIIFSNLTSSTYYYDLTYAWDFGDGSLTVSEQNPVHTYNIGDSYEVRLTVSLGGLPIGDKPKTITVGGNTCHADFSKNVMEAGLVNFHSNSVSSGNITSYYWDFGDGNTSTDENPSHTYAENGVYNVNLTITDSNGNTDFSDPQSVAVETIYQCCKANSADSDVKNYKEGERVAKLYLKERNVWPFHRLISKVVNFRIKSNGTLKRNRADVIGACSYGILHEHTCNNHWAKNLLPYDERTDGFRKKFTNNYPVGMRYRLLNENAKGWYRIEDAGVTYDVDNVLKLHNETCN